MRDMLAETLRLEGCEVLAAQDGRSGVDLVRVARPDVVISDLGLPDIDGYEVARELRSDASLASCRLLALSGFAQPEDVRRAMAAGFDAHLSKPLRLDNLRALLSAPPAPGTPLDDHVRACGRPDLDPGAVAAQSGGTIASRHGPWLFRRRRRRARHPRRRHRVRRFQRWNGPDADEPARRPARGPSGRPRARASGGPGQGRVVAHHRRRNGHSRELHRRRVRGRGREGRRHHLRLRTRSATIVLTRTAKVFNDQGPKLVIDGGNKVKLRSGGTTRILYMAT